LAPSDGSTGHLETHPLIRLCWNSNPVSRWSATYFLWLSG